MILQQQACSEPSIDHFSIDQEFPDKNVSALVHFACSGSARDIESSLATGTEVNSKGRHGYTALFWAVKCSNVQTEAKLLQGGADPNYKFPERDYSSSEAANELGYWPPEPVHICGYNAVYEASKEKDPSLLALLLTHGGNPNTECGDASHSALIEAFNLGRAGGGWDNYHALLNAGADINRADKLGETIAIYAASLGRYGDVEDLLRRGYNYNLPDLRASVEIGRPVSFLEPDVLAARNRVLKILDQQSETGKSIDIKSRRQK